MLYRAKSSIADRRSLALKSIETAPMQLDLSGMLVNKPWGHEYLLTSTPLVEIWHLSLDHLKSTSTHCHPNKKTALIVLEGGALFSTLNADLKLSPLDAVVIDAGVFHATKCISKNGLKLLEVETPPMKHDLIRLKDNYGRAGMGYEGRDKMKLANGSYIHFKSESRQVVENFCNNRLCVDFIKDSGDFRSIPVEKQGLAVILNGFIKAGSKIIHQVGDVVENEKLTNKKLNFKNASFLFISKN